jgi:predicted ATP-grasp superfamily ATP-dependent carboligase
METVFSKSNLGFKVYSVLYRNKNDIEEERKEENNLFYRTQNNLDRLNTTDVTTDD